MTLEEMRKQLVGPASTVPESSGPSLKETLDWLKEKIPLGTVQYVRLMEPNGVNGFSITSSENVQSVVGKADSCTVTVGEVSTSKTLSILPKVNNSSAQFADSSMTTRYTVPLEHLIGWTVKYQENEDPADNTFIFVSGDKWGYRVVLSSGSKVIHRVISSSLSIPSPYFPKVNSDAVYWFDIIFNNESIGRRAGQGV